MEESARGFAVFASIDRELIDRFRFRPRNATRSLRRDRRLRPERPARAFYRVSCSAETRRSARDRVVLSSESTDRFEVLADHERINAVDRGSKRGWPNLNPI